MSLAFYLSSTPSFSSKRHKTPIFPSVPPVKGCTCEEWQSQALPSRGVNNPSSTNFLKLSTPIRTMSRRSVCSSTSTAI